MDTILIIEENKMMRENLTEIMELSNKVVFSAKSCYQGSEVAKNIHPSLIICDVASCKNPELEELKNLGSKRDIIGPAFIFINGTPEEPELPVTGNCGTVEYLEMPFDGDELLGVVARCLVKREQFIKNLLTGN
jgi:DNA-binding NtrC family response regulator